MTTATVLMSGGIDSSSCAALLQSDGYDVSGLFIDFGQKAARAEATAASAVCKHLSIPLQIIKVRNRASLGIGELSGRNAFLIFSALLLGETRDGILAIGIHDGTPYYDCSSTFFEKVSDLIAEYTNSRLALVAPFLFWSKGDVYSYFHSKNIPSEITYSCESGDKNGCGTCASCRDRVKLKC